MQAVPDFLATTLLLKRFSSWKPNCFLLFLRVGGFPAQVRQHSQALEVQHCSTSAASEAPDCALRSLFDNRCIPHFARL